MYACSLIPPPSILLFIIHPSHLQQGAAPVRLPLFLLRSGVWPLLDAEQAVARYDKAPSREGRASPKCYSGCDNVGHFRIVIKVVNGSDAHMTCPT